MDSGVIGEYGCSLSSEPAMTGVHSSSSPVERAQQTGLALPAFAQQHHVVPSDQGTFQLREHGVVEAQDARPRVPPLCQRSQQVFPNFGLDAPFDDDRRPSALRRSGANR